MLSYCMRVNISIHCALWKTKSWSWISFMSFSFLKLAHLAFSSRLKETNPVCSVPSTAAPPVKAPSTAFAATDTIAPTLILFRCHAQVCTALWLLNLNLHPPQKQNKTHECVPTKPLILNISFLAHKHFTPTSRRVWGSKDSGSLCYS